MRKGRLTSIEQERRLKLLLEFIFVFRYATGCQLSEFSRVIIGITYSRWLIYYASKRGLIRSYYEPIFKTKIYYLTKKGKGFIHEEEALINHYRFDKKHAGVNAFQKHNLLVGIYLKIRRHIEVGLMNWASEWILGIGKKKRESMPNSVFVLPCGTKIALELEIEYKRTAILRGMVERYRYDIEKTSRYHALLIIITPSHNYYRGLKKRLSIIAPAFCHKYFIFADLEMLGQGLCFYKDEAKPIKEIASLLSVI